MIVHTVRRGDKTFTFHEMEEAEDSCDPSYNTRLTESDVATLELLSALLSVQTLSESCLTR